jgi:hypothetical protein
MSTDNTRQILKSNPKVTILDNTCEKFDENNQIWIKNESWKKESSHADWIICCDTDEFLYHKNIKNLFESYSSSGVTFPKTFGYCMVVEKELPKHENQIYEVDNYGIEDASFSKRVIFNPRQVYPNYDLGSHKCNPVGNIIESQNADLYLLHYKFLTLDFMLERYHRAASRLSNFNLANNLGEHYKYSDDKIKKEFDDANSRKRKVL